MVILEVFSKNIKTVYKSTLFSKATFLVLIFGIVTVVLPFIFAYKTKGFWMKRDVFYEQPDIKFKGEYVFIATTNNSSKPITCSTLPYYQQVLDFLDTCALFKVHENDDNFDGKTDTLDLSLLINLPQETYITSICIVIPLDYKLHTVCPLQMQAAIIFQTFLPVTVSSYMIVGDVAVTQSSPLICRKKRNNFYNFSIIRNEREIDGYDISNIITEYSMRNMSTVLRNVYTSFKPGKSQQFKLIFKLRYPEDTICYKPNFWQILKWAWIQYFSIYIIVSWLVQKIKRYIFNRRFVLFYEDNPVKKKRQ